jgi:hypothetical protein
MKMRTKLAMVALLAAGAVGQPTAGASKLKSLEAFLPAKIGGGRRERELRLPPLGGRPDGGPKDAHAAYLLPGRRYLNVNLMWVKDLAFEEAQFRVSAPGETHEDEAAYLSHEGFEVDGFFVQRTQYLPRPDGHGGDKSEARALLADRIAVLVSVERPNEPDEPVKWMRKLDLRGLAALARQAEAARFAAMRRAVNEAFRHKDAQGRPKGILRLEVAGQHGPLPDLTDDGDDAAPGSDPTPPSPPPSPLRLVIEHVSHGPGSKHVHARLVNDGKEPITLLLDSGDAFGPKTFSFTADGAPAIPIEDGQHHDGRVITRVLQPGSDYLVDLGPDDQLRGKRVEARYKVDAKMRGRCNDCWMGETATATLALPP